MPVGQREVEHSFRYEAVDGIDGGLAQTDDDSCRAIFVHAGVVSNHLCSGPPPSLDLLDGDPDAKLVADPWDVLHTSQQHATSRDVDGFDLLVALPMLTFDDDGAKERQTRAQPAGKNRRSLRMSGLVVSVAHAFSSYRHTPPSRSLEDASTSEENAIGRAKSLTLHVELIRFQ